MSAVDPLPLAVALPPWTREQANRRGALIAQDLDGEPLTPEERAELEAAASAWDAAMSAPDMARLEEVLRALGVDP